MSDADAYLLMISLATSSVVMLAMLWTFDEMRRVRMECGRIVYMMRHDRANADMAVRGLWSRYEKCARNWNAMDQWSKSVASRVYNSPLPPRLELRSGPAEGVKV